MTPNAVCVASSCARWAVRRCGNIAVRGYLVVFREAVQVGVLHREEVLERSLADRHHDGEAVIESSSSQFAIPWYRFL